MNKDLSYLPEGVSEEEFVAVIDRLSTSPAYKFKFGAHAVEDLKQQAAIIAIVALQEGKFKPRGDKPMLLQLTNFLRVRFWNRLNNFRRDNCCKYPNNGGANQIKFNLNYPIHIYSYNLANSEMFAGQDNLVTEVSHREILDRLSNLKNANLVKSLYERFIEGDELNESEFDRLERAVRKVLPGLPEEYVDE